MRAANLLVGVEHHHLVEEGVDRRAAAWRSARELRDRRAARGLCHLRRESLGGIGKQLRFGRELDALRRAEGEAPFLGLAQNVLDALEGGGNGEKVPKTPTALSASARAMASRTSSAPAARTAFTTS